ncbi:hypothetical protein BJ166DRAFT_597347 [Pestalotiopsis sp. NC0098]|nr:hypothetical protein BJ166DRAFT_597347 [Pestalotiopsis sp. NC0098]
MTTATSASTISASAKGKEPMRRNPFRSLNVHVPRSKRERLLQVRIATPDVLKAELVDVEHSTVDRERLASFCKVLSSKKHRLELFGREMPLSRFSLVQVTEGSSPPSNYICVHGLSTQNDITKFHTVMSQERYRPLYLPLKLCYDTARLSKVGSTDPPGLDSWEGAPTAALTPIVEPNEDEPSDTAANGLQSFHIYQPVHGDETYCGALFQTLVDGKPWTSTLGGMIDIAGSLYIMSCRHNPTESIETYNSPSSAETLLEKGFADDLEEALVFTRDDFDDGTNAFQASNSGQSQELGNDPFAHDRTWKHLNLPGSIKTGPEWCLLPVTSHSMLPNFVTISAKKRGTVDETVRKYLEQIAEPLGGRPALIGTGVGPHPSGTVLGGSSFILGGGSDGLIEVWTVLLDKDEVDIQKGDSGSWVVDTSDPIHYKDATSFILPPQPQVPLSSAY